MNGSIVLSFFTQFKGVTTDMDDNEIRKFRLVLVYANLESKKNQFKV